MYSYGDEGRGACGRTPRSGDACEMAEVSLLFGERVWFNDTRSQARRMAVSSHPGEDVFVVSFWQGDACTGTFRLPLSDGAALISTVAHGMATQVILNTLGNQTPEPAALVATSDGFSQAPADEERRA